MDVLLVVLRIAHIVSGAAWVGIAILLTLFVEPTARAAGAAGSQYMQRLGGSKMGPFISIIAIITVLGGFGLYFRMGYSLQSTAGVTLLIGGLVALAALVFGGAVTGPTTIKLGRLGAAIQSGGQPPTPEQVAQLQAITGQLRTDGRINAVLVTLAVTAMAVARYL